MPKWNWGFVILALSFGFMGCASKGFKRDELVSKIGVKNPTFNEGEKEIQEAFKKKANLPKPFKMAVYFKEPLDQMKWRWTNQDKEILESVTKELQSQGLVSDVYPISRSLVEAQDVKSLRVVAAKHQADALLVVGGGYEIDRYTNDFAWTYLLLVPTLFVPGSEVDTLFISHAALWDVRNEFLYLTAETEAVVNHSYIPAFGKSEKELIEEAKKESLMKLKQEIQKLIQGQKKS